MFGRWPGRAEVSWAGHIALRFTPFWKPAQTTQAERANLGATRLSKLERRADCERDKARENGRRIGIRKRFTKGLDSDAHGQYLEFSFFLFQSICQ